jgi:AraC-like DNA-binding protein
MRVSLLHVRALAEYAERVGVSTARLLESAGVEPALLTMAWIDLDAFDRLMVAALREAADPAFGLHWGDLAPVAQYDLLSILVAQSPSVWSAIHAILRFQAIFSEHLEIEFQDRGGSAEFRFAPLGKSPLGLQVRSEVVTAAMMRLLREVGSAAQPKLKRVSFVHARPAHHAEYERVFEGPVSFGQREYKLEFSYRALDVPGKASDPELHAVLETQAERVLARIQQEGSFAEHVRVFLRRVAPRVPEMQEAARSLGLSVRSLRRRLAEESTSYAALIEQSQLDAAMRILDDPTKSVKEASFAAGFANVSSFHRAFKRWTGKSPLSARDPLKR